jgi:hypothetical protein
VAIDERRARVFFERAQDGGNAAGRQFVVRVEGHDQRRERLAHGAIARGGHT